MLGWIIVAVGVIFAVGAWAHAGMQEKVLGLYQLAGWPALGIVVACLGVVVIMRG